MNAYALRQYMTATDDYKTNFWNYLRGQDASAVKLNAGAENGTGSYVFPKMNAEKCESAISRESVMRNLASVYTNYHGPSSIYAAESDDIVTFVDETGSVPVSDVADDFTKISLGRYKLASILRLAVEFVSDAAFDLESYLEKRLGRAYARAEDKAFITGTGEDEPTGILHETDGADVADTVATLTYDDIIKLYFSVKPEYRKNGVWLMNDKTAMALRKLKDNDGNYLWRESNDSILDKKVVISEFMPDVDEGSKPIAFGDFSFYWIVRRSPLSIKTIKELYALNGQLGYLSYEFIDGKLIRSDAVKVLQIADTEE